MPIIAIDKHTGKLENTPEVVTRGFAAEDSRTISEAREVIQRVLGSSSAEERADYGVIKEKIRSELKRAIQKNTGRRPLIMPVILEL